MLAAAPKRLARLGSSDDSLIAFCIEGRYCRFGGEEAVSGEGMGAFWQQLSNCGVMNFARSLSISPTADAAPARLLKRR